MAYSYGIVFLAGTRYADLLSLKLKIGTWKSNRNEILNEAVQQRCNYDLTANSWTTTGVEWYNTSRGNCCPKRGVHEFIYNLLFVHFVVVVVAHFIVTAPVVALIFTLAFRFRLNYAKQKHIPFLFLFSSIFV